MIPLTEDVVKSWLRSRGLPIPAGTVVRSAEEARDTSVGLPGAVVLKALVPIGGRGKAGGVLRVDSGNDRAVAAASLLGGRLRGFAVDAVYVESKVDIATEFFLSFVLRGDVPEIIVSLHGGVNVEDVARADSSIYVVEKIDPVEGLTPWGATEVWLRAGLTGQALPPIAALTCRLYEAFCDADALTLEVNPLALAADGSVHVVGAMMSVDERALFRQPHWKAFHAPLPDNPRERAVMIANSEHGDGECRYVELAGDIGLLVGGGGAGLYQHDLVLELGGAPANHCVTPPTSSDDRKLKAVLGAIFDNPNVRGLLVGFNFAQMARTDVRVRALVEVLSDRQIDTTRLPVVIRLFGAGEAESRAMVAGVPNVHYVPRGTTLKEAARMIVDLTRRTNQSSTVCA